MSILGLVGNIFNVSVFISSRKLRVPTNFFLILLSVSDMLLLTLLLQSSVADGDSQMGDVWCMAQASLITLCFISSAFCIACTAIVRYINILHFSRSKTLYTWRRCFFLTVFIVTLALVLISPTWAGVVQVSYFEEFGVCNIPWQSSLIYRAILYTAGCCVPMSIFCFFYFKIYSEQRKSGRRVQSHTTGVNAQTSRAKRNELALAQQVLLIGVCFCASYGSGSLVMAVSEETTLYRITCEVTTVLVVLNV